MSWADEVEPVYSGVANVWRVADPEADDDPRSAVYIPGITWLIYAPLAHPHWAWHLLVGVSLADAPGVDPPKKHYPEAEYELMVWALDPRNEPPDPREWPFGSVDGWLLQPPDCVVQFDGPSQDEVSEMFDVVARAVAEGTLVPDSDHRGKWAYTIRKTAEHYRGHPEDY